jgi:uncharacterized OsmC-like protein
VYKIEITHDKDLAFLAKNGDQEVLIDAKGDNFNPPNLLLAALGSCIGAYLRKYSEGSNINLAKFSILIEAEFSKEKPLSFREINVYINLKESQIDERRKEPLLNFIKNCPVHNTLKINPVININFK